MTTKTPATKSATCFTLALQSCNNKTYTIHGLWPRLTRETKPKPLCQLDALSIKALWKDLDRYHKDCFGNNVKFLEHQWCKHGIFAFETPMQYFQLSLKAYHFVLKKVGNRINKFAVTGTTKHGKTYTNYKIPLFYDLQRSTFNIATCDGSLIKF